MSNKGLARRVVDLAKARGAATVRCDHTSVLRWLAGEQPRPPVPELIASVLGDALGRPVPEIELGMTPSDLPADLGLHLPTVWADTVAISTALWRADVQRRRFLVNAAFAAAAMPASALRWLTSPPASAPTGNGPVRVGHADIEAIRELTLSYRELDNQLGGGRLRAVILSYLDDHVSHLLINGSYREETGRQLAAACGELSQLAGWVAYDSGKHGVAQRYLTQALAYARHAGDHALGAEILAAQAPGPLPIPVRRGHRPVPRRPGRRAQARISDTAQAPTKLGAKRRLVADSAAEIEVAPSGVSPGIC